MPSGGEISGYAALIAVVMQQLPNALNILSSGRLGKRKAALEELQFHQTKLDESYERLERENKRLNEEVDSLRADLEEERASHQKTRDRCSRLEDTLRMFGLRQTGNDT